MSIYTVRDAVTLAPLASETNLEAAIDHLDSERLAFLLNPPPAISELELLITVDESAGTPGSVIVRFAAGPVRSDIRFAPHASRSDQEK
jgi:hypothetical protein